MDFDLSPIKRSFDAIVQATSPGDLVVQAAVCAATIGLAYMLARGICSRFPESKRWRFGKGDFERVAFPLLALLFTVIAQHIVSNFQSTDSGPMEVVISLLVPFALIRIASYILGMVLPEGGLQRSLIRWIVTIAW